jgi:hypothetical protein
MKRATTFTDLLVTGELLDRTRELRALAGQTASGDPAAAIAERRPRSRENDGNLLPIAGATPDG